MICYVLFVFSILVSVTGRGEEATVPYKPADLFLFNCGETSVTIDTGGRTWMPEKDSILPSNSESASFSSYTSSYKKSGIAQVPYMTARIFKSDFTYSFPLSPGWKFIRLHFYPAQYGYGPDFDAVSSFFSVNVNGFDLLTNFSADLTVKASKAGSTLIKEFIVPVYQTLNLTFTPSPNSLAFVNGVEIVSMPDRFYSKGGFDDKITNVGHNVDFEIDNSTAFETVYRLNVGGDIVTDVSDSGMFRRWLSDDDEFLHGGVVNVADIMINYTEKTPAYVAPAYVYATSRMMGNPQDPELNLNFNMTWLFTVDAGFNYLVRLHFCETIPQDVNKESQRVFSIFLGNQIAKLYMDVIYLSGGS